MAEPLRSIGGYALEALIGQGGMGSVFRATHPQHPGRLFALKVMLDDAPSPEDVGRFRREMETLARASQHPHVVRIFGGSVEGKRPFFVMELAPGSSLHALAKDAPLEPARAARIGRQIADAVAHLHSLGIVHRDLKPQNVVVGPDDVTKILDFGLAKVAGASHLTRTGASVGTVAYSAPEQLDGQAKEARPVADVYALGGVLSFALTGRDPFEAEGSPLSLLKKVLTEPATPPSWSAAGVPPELDAVCLRALEKNQAARYESAAAFRDDLDRFLAGEPVSVRLPTTRERLGRWVRRHRAKTAALALVGLAASAAAFVAGAHGLQLRAHDRLLEEVTRERDAAARARTAADVSGPLANLAAMRQDPRYRDVGEIAGFLDEARAVLVRARQSDARAKVGAGGRLEPTDLEALAAAAREAPGAASLVGEVAGSGFSLGDALLDSHDPKLVAVALELATRRLKLDPADPAARALRVYASLESAHAPTRPLGVGRLGHVLTADERADLVAVAATPGEVGARAAWLLADLLVCAGPGSAEDAKRALDLAARQATASAPNRKARASLERALAATPDADGFASLLADLGPDGANLEAAVVLSRFFAHQGDPEALEHPELVAASDGRELEQRLAVALACDPPGEFTPLAQPAPPPDVTSPEPIDRAAVESGNDLARQTRQRQPGATIVFEPTDLAKLRGSVERYPRGFYEVYHSGHPELVGLAAAVHFVLSARYAPTFTEFLATMFTKDVRGSIAAFLDFARENNLGSSFATTNHFFAPDVWETTKTGEAACAEFDAALARSLEKDELLHLAQNVSVDPLPTAEVERATSAARGLRRAEELHEAELAPAERSRIAFATLRQLEDLRRLGGVTVLTPRARVRLEGLPGRLGVVLARLDFERLKREASVGDDRFREPRTSFDWSGPLLVAAAYACALPHVPRAVEVHRELYVLGVRWRRELILWRSDHDRVPLEAMGTAVAEYAAGQLGDLRQELGSKTFYRPLKDVGGLTDEDFNRDLALSSVDRARLAKPYEFHDPAARSK